MVRLYVKLESNEVGHLHAQVKGKASLFIPAYLLALGVMDLEMYATGSRLPLTSTAPRPEDDASVEGIVSRFGLNMARTGLPTNTCLTFSKACRCAFPIRPALCPVLPQQFA